MACDALALTEDRLEVRVCTLEESASMVAVYVLFNDANRDVCDANIDVCVLMRAIMVDDQLRIERCLYGWLLR